MDRIRSKELVRALCSLPDSPWLEANRGNQPITERWLANHVHEYGMKSETLRIGERIANGYALADFAGVREVFAVIE